MGESENSGFFKNFGASVGASDLKVRRSSHLIEYMKVCEYLRSWSFFYLSPRLCTYKNSNWIFSKLTLPI